MEEKIIVFSTVFLGIFIEAAPFLLLGSFASGLVEVFVSRDNMTRLVPRSIIPATLMGGMMGFAFPVCECGVVPLTRRLFIKGFPVSAGIAFLLAAPIINPVALASTYAAYGFGDVLVMRFALGLTIPVFIGMVFAVAGSAPKILLPSTYLAPIRGASGVTSDSVERLEAIKVDAPVAGVTTPEPLVAQLRQATRVANDEFFEMAKYLIIGCILAALMQTFVTQEDILSLGSGPVTSVIFMQVLAYVLSVCSTVDAFISLSFVNAFTTGSILGFLVFGPMVDIKSTLMFLGVFRKNVVFYLVAVAFLSVLLVSVFINLNIGL
ncbi:MAG: permease [Chloroflexi bacterium]|nr:permease [Chloroflexota bacterium]